MQLRSFHESDWKFFLIAAVKYIESRKLPIDDSDFNKKCGVGTLVGSTVDLSATYHYFLDFSIAPEELYALVEAHVASNDIAGWSSLGPVVSALKNSPELRWAAPLDVKNAVDKAFIAKFGPKESSAKSKTKVSRYSFSLVNRRRFNDVFVRNQNLRPNSPERMRLLRSSLEGLSSKKAFLANFINLEEIPKYTLISVMHI